MARARASAAAMAPGSSSGPSTRPAKPITTLAPREIVALEDGADAIVAVPEGSATGVLQAVTAAGLRVPQDMLVAGYTDSPELAGLATPITAVDLGVLQIAQQATVMLADLIAGRVQPGARRELPTELRIRASTSRHR